MSYGICVDVQALLVERLSANRFSNMFKKQFHTIEDATNSAHAVPAEDKKILGRLYGTEQ